MISQTVPANPGSAVPSHLRHAPHTVSVILLLVLLSLPPLLTYRDKLYLQCSVIVTKLVNLVVREANFLSDICKFGRKRLIRLRQVIT